MSPERLVEQMVHNFTTSGKGAYMLFSTATQAEHRVAVTERRSKVTYGTLANRSLAIASTMAPQLGGETR